MSKKINFRLGSLTKGLVLMSTILFCANIFAVGYGATVENGLNKTIKIEIRPDGKAVEIKGLQSKFVSSAGSGDRFFVWSVLDNNGEGIGKYGSLKYEKPDKIKIYQGLDKKMKYDLIEKSGGKELAKYEKMDASTLTEQQFGSKGYDPKKEKSWGDEKTGGAKTVLKHGVTVKNESGQKITVYVDNKKDKVKKYSIETGSVFAESGSGKRTITWEQADGYTYVTKEYSSPDKMTIKKDGIYDLIEGGFGKSETKYSDVKATEIRGKSKTGGTTEELIKQQDEANLEKKIKEIKNTGAKEVESLEKDYIRTYFSKKSLTESQKQMLGAALDRVDSLYGKIDGGIISNTKTIDVIKELRKKFDELKGIATKSAVNKDLKLKGEGIFVALLSNLGKKEEKLEVELKVPTKKFEYLTLAKAKEEVEKKVKEKKSTKDRLENIEELLKKIVTQYDEYCKKFVIGSGYVTTSDKVEKWFNDNKKTLKESTIIKDLTSMKEVQKYLEDGKKDLEKKIEEEKKAKEAKEKKKSSDD